MTIQTFHTKVCIVGAGPAGATTSIFLGKYQIPHFIIDAACFPRDKICGDGLDLKAIGILNQIDKNIIKNNIKQSDKIQACWGFRLIHPSGKRTEFVFDPNTSDYTQPPYAISKRTVIDTLLVQQIDPEYSTFLQNTVATKIKRINGKWKISASQENKNIEIYCDLIVGADGERSMVLKTVGDRKIDRNNYAGGVRQYWSGVEGMHEKHLMEVYYPKSKPMSYLWIFPLGGGYANIGYGMLSSVASKYNYNIKSDFKDILEKDPLIADRLKNAKPEDSIRGWGLPLASLQRKCYGDGWLLVGDAASMVSPTTGEGIGTGMTTGLIAARFIQRAVQQNKFDESVLKNYDREIFRRVKDDINLFKISMWFSPKMMGWVMNNLIQLPMFKKMFQQKVTQWLHTAYHKDLVVNLD
ncbi:MAG: NAD(P)/FAD-dependent oxidoreductase [Chitinophagaceae bacterium]|nr:NAD(P)/FAD-dependent oxidoreductase [Chitinophagaceae bacterium]